MSQVIAEFTATIRKELRRKQAALADADVQGDEVVRRRVEKSIANRVAKLLCPHTYITHKRLRVHGFDKHSYQCNACKMHILSATEL